MRYLSIITCGLLVFAAFGPLPLADGAEGNSAPLTAAQLEFFEKRIRPALASECYECHSGDAAKGGLKLDTRDALRTGGRSGPAIVPGDADASLLMQVIRHTHPKLKMPKGRAQLDEAVIADLAAWIRDGAPDPRLDASEKSSDHRDWSATLEARRTWWSFQAPRDPVPPKVRDTRWSDHAVDRFTLARMEQAGLTPTKAADRRVLIRRLSFDLLGLPPTPAEVEAFAADVSDGAYAALVDRLLASPHFGERWARHWMDWVRYAESHGSEGDVQLQQAYEYRDYLIRALNDDVPYDQLVREHIAGDLLDQPRLNSALALNESAIGPAHFRMVEHGFQPVDPLEDKAKFRENQIDVLTKAFQALTVSCARCHNHKFDPISQADYYALYGILESTRLVQRPIDLPQTLRKNVDALAALKPRIRDALAEAWLSSLSDLPQRLRGLPERDAKAEGLPALLDGARRDVDHPLHAWLILKDKDGRGVQHHWPLIAAQRATELQRHEQLVRSAAALRLDPVARPEGWARIATGSAEAASPAGSFALYPGGESVIAIYPAGVYAHLLSSRHVATVVSPRFKITSPFVSVRLMGSGFAQARLIIEDYPLMRHGIYKQFISLDNESELRWVTWDARYWSGYTAHIEITTMADAPFVAPKPRGAADRPNTGRSAFGIAEVLMHDDLQGEPRLRTVGGGGLILAGDPPRDVDDLAGRYASAAERAIRRWKSGELNDEEAALLQAMISAGLLPSSLQALPTVAPLLSEYRRLEAAVPVARRAPGVLDARGENQPMHVRGDHKTLGEAVPRGYMQVLGGGSYGVQGSGRRELAEAIASPANPLTARVAVNRVWHYLFGRGLVATVDNFGRLGDKPTHPELLDHLAMKFVADGWSLKRIIRYVVMSQTYQLDATPTPAALRFDASNDLLSHARIRRLDAESVRDNLLRVSGLLDAAAFGRSTPPNAPVSENTRRSLYLALKRNTMPQFLETFDFPKPFTTIGRRESTNVPAQSLALLNDPFVIDCAKRWESSVVDAGLERSVDERINRMFHAALARFPEDAERDAARRFIALTAGADLREEQVLRERRVWQDFAQSLFNLKEFIFVR